MKTLRRARRDAQAGFTLAELMVVVVLSSLSLTFMYFLFIHQSQLARIQGEIGDMQTSLQFAVASLERDLRRAGYMSIVTTQDQRLCVAYANQDFNAINFKDADPSSPSSAKNTNVRADSIELFGNYSTTDDFSGYIDPANPNRIIVDFASSVGSSSSINNLESFEQAFHNSNQLVMIKGQTGNMQIVQLNTSTPASNVYNIAQNRARLVVANGLPINTSSNCGIAIRFRIAPLLKIRYRIKALTTEAWELTRETLDPGLCTVSGSCSGGNWAAMATTTLNPPLAIAPNAVDLQFWFSTWNSTTNLPQNWDPRCTGASNPTCSGAQVAAMHSDTGNWPANPAQIRSVFFRISVRTQNEDPSLPFFARPNTDSALLTYDLDPGEVGAARVRTIVKNVMLFNMLAR